MPTLPVELYAGTLTDFNDSMAKEIEDALARVLGPLPSAPEQLVNDRRALFIAIADGVLRHLKAKERAVDIKNAGITTSLQLDFNVRGLP
jgi:hypothetical protein